MCVCLRVCLPDITAREFLEPRERLRSRYDLLVDFLSEMLSVTPDEVNVFSLMDVREKTLDVRFAVHAAQSYLQPEKLHGYLVAHKQKVGGGVAERTAFYIAAFLTSGHSKRFTISPNIHPFMRTFTHRTAESATQGDSQLVGS